MAAKKNTLWIEFKKAPVKFTSFNENQLKEVIGFLGNVLIDLYDVGDIDGARLLKANMVDVEKIVDLLQNKK